MSLCDQLKVVCFPYQLLVELILHHLANLLLCVSYTGHKVAPTMSQIITNRHRAASWLACEDVVVSSQLAFFRTS